MKKAWIPLIIILLILAVILPISYVNFASQNSTQKTAIYFGITFGGNNTAQAEQLINKVQSYTNLFIVASWTVDTLNEPVNGTTLSQICDYAISQGLSLIVYFSFISHIIYPWQFQWIQQAKEKYGTKLLGIYFYDEPGGKQIDAGSWGNDTTPFKNAKTYSDYANDYVENLSSVPSMQNLTALRIPAFTSDYALYWFDYLAGYSCVLVELYGTNQTSKIQQIDICRGAADVQDKQWGAILTYSTNQSLENGTLMIEDMQTAYQAGARYIVVFDYPETNQYGNLTSDQFDAMRTFWSQIHSTQKNTFGIAFAKAALVLPKDYGWGMRNPNDNIWGNWSADAQAPIIWRQINQLISIYGLRLDIIYNDTSFNFGQKFSEIYYWNSQTVGI